MLIGRCVAKSDEGAYDSKVYPVTDCYDLWVPDVGLLDGVYGLKINNMQVKGYCDMTGGGWTIIQRRESAQVNFSRPWEDYKRGFGDLEGNFWFGNEYIANLVNSKATYTLRVELSTEKGQRFYAEYNDFRISPEADNFQLTSLGDFEGSIGDAMRASGSHNQINMYFSTYDKDNDNSPHNCARDRFGGWWYNDCGSSDLNSVYKGQRSPTIDWRPETAPFYPQNDTIVSTIMKLKPNAYMQEEHAQN
jgi:hypothetical protein